MRELDKTQAIIFALGATLMVIGVGVVVFGPQLAVDSRMYVRGGTVCFAAGAFLFAGMQMFQAVTSRFDGCDSMKALVLRRLRNMMVFADVCFILAALLLVENTFKIVFPYVATTIEGCNNYIRYVHNNWVVVLLVAAILEMYSTHRISREISR